jgi:hypothetical protein
MLLAGMPKHSLTLKSLTPSQRALYRRMMQGRAPLSREERQETLRDVARLKPEEIEAERQWYGLADLPLNHSSSSLAQAIGFDCDD